MSMMFSSAAFDEATRHELAKIAARGTDRFGDPLHSYAPISYDKVRACLRDEPMRARQIAVRTQYRRSAVESACEHLLATGQVWRDEEAFYSINEPERH